MFRIVLLYAFIVGCFGSELQNRLTFQDSRIVGGVEVDISQHPYQLSFQTSRHICGASIISTKWAITAAHCVGSPPSQYKVRAGSTDNNLGTPYSIKRIIVHPNYDRRTSDYDVALLEINGEIKLNKNVQPVKLANKEPLTNTIVNVTGWGALRQGGPATSQLMRVSVPIVNRIECQNAYRYLHTLTPRMICAGLTSGGKDACQGDSGGPLTSNGILYGIVSWGYGCAQPRYPGVYSNVADLRAWIKSNSGV